MSDHDHRAYVPGCFRCEIGRAEERNAMLDEMSALGQEQALREACVRLLAAYDEEEATGGFPFSFELRDAHRALRALINPHTPEEG